jgi:Spy/CpxP family protein refolding chaperone
MRKAILLTLTVATLTACNESSAPVGNADLDALTSLSMGGGIAYGISGVHPGRGLPELRRLHALPDSIALTAAQETEIDALLTAFQTVNRADLDSLGAIFARAREAVKQGATRAEVQAILGTGAAIQARVAIRVAELRAAIDAVLTPSQRAWLASRPPRCDPSTAPALTEAQKTQIKALFDTFKTANAADLAAVKAAHDSAQAARKAGATRAEVQAILASVSAQMERLKAAGGKLRADIAAVLTPEQLQSGCFARGLTHGIQRGMPHVFGGGFGRGRHRNG